MVPATTSLSQEPPRTSEGGQTDTSRRISSGVGVPEADIRQPNFTDRNKKLSESWLEFAASYPWSYGARAKEGRPSCTQTHGINAVFE